MLFYSFIVTMIIFILIIYIILCGVLFQIKQYPDLTGKILSLDNLNTGDIFLVAYTGASRAICDLSIGQTFSHGCIFVREKYEDFIIEYGFYDDKWKGVMKIPFRIWLRFNKNQLIYHKPLKIVDDSQDKRLELSEKITEVYEKNIGGTMHMINYRRFLFPSYEYTGLYKKFVCVEFLAEVLAQTNIRERNFGNEYFTPNRIYKGNINTTDKYKYEMGYACNVKFLIKSFY